jgi:ABC-type glycerol-3-phosphate transport system substrate-binding protein
MEIGGLGVGVLGLASCGSNKPSTPAANTSTNATPTRATGSTNAAKAVTITAWTWSAAGDLQNVFEAVKKAYPKELGHVQLKVETVGTGDPDVVNKLNLTLAAHGTMPDLVKLVHPEIPPFVEAGVLADFSPLVTKEVEDDMLAGAKAATMYKGKYYGVVHAIQAKLFWYRKDLFRAAGVDPHEVGTMTSFIAAGHKFTKRFPGRYIINVGQQTGGEDAFDMVASAYPGVSLPANNYALDNPGIAKAFEFYRELKQSKIGYPTDDFSTDWAPAIKKGNICGFLMPTWMPAFLPGYAGASQAHKWTATLWPTFEPDYANQQNGGDFGGDLFVVPKDAPNKDIAMEFLRLARFEAKGVRAAFNAAATWFSPLKSQIDWTLHTVQHETKPSGVAAKDWALRPQQFFGPEVYKSTFTAFDRVQVVDYGTTFVKAMAILGPWMNKAINGAMPVAQAIDGLRTDLRQQLS